MAPDDNEKKLKKSVWLTRWSPELPLGWRQGFKTGVSSCTKKITGSTDKLRMLQPKKKTMNALLTSGR